MKIETKIRRLYNDPAIDLVGIDAFHTSYKNMILI